MAPELLLMSVDPLFQIYVGAAKVSVLESKFMLMPVVLPVQMLTTIHDINPKLCDDGSGTGETTFKSSKLMMMTMMKTGLSPQKSQMMRTSQHRSTTHQRENGPKKLPISVDLVQNSHWSTRSVCSRSQLYDGHARRPSPHAQMLTTITSDHIGEAINASVRTLHRFRSPSTPAEEEVRFRTFPKSLFCSA